MIIGARRSRIGNFFPLMVALIVILCVLSIRLLGYGMTYQYSASMPIGLSVVVPVHHIQRHDIVIFRLTPAIRNGLLRQGWQSPPTILMKTVMAIPGDVVCKRDQAIWVNHQCIAPVIHQHFVDQPFCQVLPANYYLLMSTHHKNSFDSRYFGPVSIKQILGRVIKV